MWVGGFFETSRICIGSCGECLNSETGPCLNAPHARRRRMPFLRRCHKSPLMKICTSNFRVQCELHCKTDLTVMMVSIHWGNLLQSTVSCMEPHGHAEDHLHPVSTACGASTAQTSLSLAVLTALPTPRIVTEIHRVNVCKESSHKNAWGTVSPVLPPTNPSSGP